MQGYSVGERIMSTMQYIHFSPSIGCTVQNIEHGNIFGSFFDRFSTCTNLTETGQYSVGSNLRYYCEPGYNLLGYAFTFCIGNNTWWPPLGTCIQGLYPSWLWNNTLHGVNKWEHVSRIVHGYYAVRLIKIY